MQVFTRDQIPERYRVDRISYLIPVLIKVKKPGEEVRYTEGFYNYNIQKWHILDSEYFTPGPEVEFVWMYMPSEIHNHEL